jgi:hypothetical protein
VLVWKNETIILRGEGNVRLRPGVQVAKDTQFVTKQIETSKFVQEPAGIAGYAQAVPQPYPTTKSPGFGIPLVLAALGSLAMFTGMRRRKP